MRCAEGEGSGDLGPLHVNVWNAIIESVMCKAHIGDAYCIAAASATRLSPPGSTGVGELEFQGS